MAEANDVYGSIYQNLIDAGCDTKTTEQCMALIEDGRYCDTLPIRALANAGFSEAGAAR